MRDKHNISYKIDSAHRLSEFLNWPDSTHRFVRSISFFGDSLTSSDATIFERLSQIASQFSNLESVDLSCTQLAPLESNQIEKLFHALSCLPVLRTIDLRENVEFLENDRHYALFCTKLPAFKMLITLQGITALPKEKYESITTILNNRKHTYKISNETLAAFLEQPEGFYQKLTFLDLSAFDLYKLDEDLFKKLISAIAKCSSLDTIVGITNLAKNNERFSAFSDSLV